MKLKKIVFIFTLLVTAGLFSQEEAETDLKVGLVLSGGGAKGLAHIGALKVLEDSGVRVDYIGGTSMGAIIGGLYAAGYSARQLDSIFQSIDFETLIQDDVPRSAKTFFEKGATEKYAITLPFDNFQLKFPSGISKGQNVYNLISKLTSHVSHIRNFENLPIPFFCVATNVETGEEVLLDEGYLPRAITASGALPSLFSPVVINEKVLVDGGVVNNYPVDEVRAKGADIIIGVDVQDSLRARDNLRSAFSVMVQINNFRTIEDMIEKRKKTDVYIHPSIDDFSVVSFNEGRRIIEAGEAATSAYLDTLAGIAKKQRPIKKPAVQFDTSNSIFISKIDIEGNENYSRSYVLGKLKLRIADEVTYARFNEGVNNLSATGNFQDINYRFIETDKDVYTVKFQLRESDSRTLLRLGAHYDDLFRAAGLANVTRKRLFTNNDIASFDFIVGDNIRYNFNYYIDKGFYWSVGLSSRYDFFDKDVDVDFLLPEIADETVSINELSLRYGDLTNRIYVETLFKRTFLLGMGVEHKWLKFLSETIGIDEDNNPRTVFENTNYFSTYGYLKYDTFDNTFFPRAGLFFEGDFHLYLLAKGQNDDFDKFSIAKAKAGYAFSFLNDFSVHLGTEGGFTIGNDATRSLDFFMGGYGFKRINNIIPLLGYEALSLRGNTYLRSEMTIDYELFSKNHLNATVNISKIGDDLFTEGRWIDGIDHSGFALGYGLETFLGPIEVKYSYSPELDASEWFVSAGFRF